MTTTPTALTPADHYLAEVRRHLGALHDDERDDLLDDLAAHVHEVAARDDRPLAEVLGPPEDFAAELIASAGLAPAAGDGPGAAARAWDRVTARVAAGRAHPWTRAAVDFLPQLRPAWWVARGWLVVYGVSLVFGNGASDWFPVPRLFGNALLGLVATFAAVVGSVRLARRPRRPRWLWALNGFAVLTAVVLPWSINDGGRSCADCGVSYPVGNSQLTQPDGHIVSNIYAYDANGRSLRRVRLYDQNGQPLQLGIPFDEAGDELTHDTVPGPDGGEATNVYPQHQTVTSPDGTTTEAPRPIIVVPPLPAPTTPTTVPRTTTTTTGPGS